MYISIETSELKPTDVVVLRAIADALEGVPAAPVDKPAKAAEKSEPEAKEEAPKRRTRKAAAPKPDPEPEPDESDADVSVDDITADDDDDADEGEGGSVDDAVDRATALVQAGKQSAVRAALKEVGAKRVSELKPAQVGEFLAALKDA